MVNLRDLPEAMQKQALAAAGVKEKQPKKSPSSRLTGWCVQCGEAIASEPAWDRHVAATGCRRNLRCWPPLVEDDPPTNVRCVP